MGNQALMVKEDNRRPTIPGQNPVELVQAKAIRNQIWMLQQESKEILAEAIQILQRKWQIDERIRQMKAQQEKLTRNYFESNGLVKRSKPPERRKTELEQLAEEFEMSVSEVVAVLRSGLKGGGE